MFKWLSGGDQLASNQSLPNTDQSESVSNCIFSETQSNQNLSSDTEQEQDEKEDDDDVDGMPTKKQLTNTLQGSHKDLLHPKSSISNTITSKTPQSQGLKVPTPKSAPTNSIAYNSSINLPSVHHVRSSQKSNQHHSKNNNNNTNININSHNPSSGQLLGNGNNVNIFNQGSLINSGLSNESISNSQSSSWSVNQSLV